MRRWRGALAGLALGCAAAWFWSGRFDSRVWLLGQEEGAELVLSLAELGRYTGAENSAGLYLAVLGQVFDVQRGRQHYGPGGAYSFFSGKVAGRFYDENGAATALLKQAQALIQEGQHLQAQEEEEKHHWPPCNAEWSARSGSRVLCSKQSGGISQEWTGVPRKLYEPGSSHSRCVCVRTEAPSSGPPQSRPDERGDLDNPNLQEYEGCHPQADWCALKDYSPA
ncbi:neuferricin isoform X2 [Hemicordylus capensis]|uniref:neuferricin isoform X2 n=1 Tax=Hemicordylus capensis TaxID=884348 RepID=UPI002304360A|nr:neuferricin isoform X2 [Hemicordylus capensis]